MSNGEDQSPPGPTKEQLADMPSAQLSPPAPSGYQGPVDARLADLRAPYEQQFEDNPDLMRKFAASIYGETDGLSKDFQQAYVEATLNRSARRHETLDYTLSNDSHKLYGKNKQPGYYDHRTIVGLDKQFSPDELSYYQELVHNAMQGSNMANYGTGNESDDLHNGPTTLAAGDKHNNRIIAEEPEQEWWKTMTSTPRKASLVSAPLGAGPLGSPDIVRPPSSQNPPIAPLGSSPDIIRPPQYENPPVATSVPDTTTPVRRAEPVQTFQNPVSGNIEPVQSFAKGGMALPVPDTEEPDEDNYLRKHPGGWGSLGAVNA